MGNDSCTIEGCCLAVPSDGCEARGRGTDTPSSPVADDLVDVRQGSYRVVVFTGVLTTTAGGAKSCQPAVGVRSGATTTTGRTFHFQSGDPGGDCEAPCTRCGDVYHCLPGQ